MMNIRRKAVTARKLRFIILILIALWMTGCSYIIGETVTGTVKLTGRAIGTGVKYTAIGAYHAVRIPVVGIYRGVTYPFRGDDYPTNMNMQASWYGDDFKGLPTASGEIFDPDGLTAAHKTLPLGTVLRVTNPENGKSVQVTVNDRGPFVEGRDLDLSRKAAERIEIRKLGVAPVIVDVLKYPE